MRKAEYVLSALRKIEQTVSRVIANSEQITSYDYYYLSPAGMERLERYLYAVDSYRREY